MEIISESVSATTLEPSIQDSRLRKILWPVPEFSLIGPSDPACDEMQHYISHKFQDAYGANIDKFLPLLLSMRCLGTLSGAVGMRTASSSTLFLEQYLDETIEAALSAEFNCSVERTSIVEIGNLVGTAKGASHIVFLIFTSMLKQAGYEWVVFTATSALQNNLSKLGFVTHLIQEADPRRLSASVQSQWGRYYDSRPGIFVGQLDNAIEVIEQSALFRRVKTHYQSKIDVLAEEFKVLVQR